MRDPAEQWERIFWLSMFGMAAALIVINIIHLIGG